MKVCRLTRIYQHIRFAICSKVLHQLYHHIDIACATSQLCIGTKKAERTKRKDKQVKIAEKIAKNLELYYAF